MIAWAVLLATASIRLTAAPPVAPGVSGYPRIAGPANAAERRINAALARLDARARAAVRECLGDGARSQSWKRRIDATMRGPEFVSYLVVDDYDCGGAYPPSSHAAIVYDLRTGRPVDWHALLSAEFAGTLALDDGPDGVRMATLASRRLTALYREGYRHESGDMTEDEACIDTVSEWEGDATPMLAWLDARQGALMLQFDLNHAMQTCSAPVAIPLATLAREGASPRLLAALRRAR